eukprot:TRINITY_DN1173_c0_g1_i1.p1 TRINITY_DN1173_c0_g1~~TRINITY_DN1173_c0_g1_i1.p1  ORF type:complete len:120 (+),score=1.08 TRINITY_DN1173_c0_g1_i1:331-690(+)
MENKEYNQEAKVGWVNKFKEDGSRPWLKTTAYYTLVLLFLVFVSVVFHSAMKQTTLCPSKVMQTLSFFVAWYFLIVRVKNDGSKCDYLLVIIFLLSLYLLSKSFLSTYSAIILGTQTCF